MTGLPAFWHHNKVDPVFWVCVIGAVVSLFLLALMPLAVMDYGDPPLSTVPCPASWHDARCTEVLPHAR